MADKLTPAQVDTLKAFKADLDALLKRYNCMLYGDYDGDGHGIYNETFCVEFNVNRDQANNAPRFEATLNEDYMRYPD